MIRGSFLNVALTIKCINVAVALVNTPWRGLSSDKNVCDSDSSADTTDVEVILEMFYLNEG